MKCTRNVRIVTLARTAAGICLMAAVLLGNQSNAQSNPSSDAEELARLRAQVEALTKENAALKNAQQPQRSEAVQPAVAATPTPTPAAPSAPAPAQRSIPVVSTPRAPSTTLSPTGEEVIQMEAMSVTGSNIKQLDVEKILPVTVFNKEAIDLRNAIDPTDLLMAVPQVTGLSDVESHSASAGPRGDNANINVRNLGANAALILINGRRVAPQPMAGGLAVNVNQLPTQGMSAVEVLRDGASSIYGSDAVAGVVNYVMRADYRGTNVRFKFSAPDSLPYDGMTGDTTITHGADFAGGRGRYVTTIDAFYREAIFLKNTHYKDADHTSIAPPPFNAAGSAFDSRAAVSEWPKFSVGTSAVNNYFYLIGGVPTLTTVAPKRGINESAFHNNNYDTMASPRTRRENMFNHIEYDLNDRITAFADISFYKADSATTRQPISMNAPTSDLPVPMNVDNPYNPYGSHFYDVNGAPNADGTPRIKGAPQQTVLLAEMIRDLPPDRIVVSDGTYRFVEGLKGKLTDTWNWEAGTLYAQYYSFDSAPNSVRESAFRAANMLTSVSPQADPRYAAEATAFNPFGYTFKVQNGAVVADQVYKNPQSVMETFVDPRWRQDGRSFVGSVDARASGRLFTIWSGDINLSLGGEYRKESFRWTRPYDLSTRNDYYVSSPIPDNSGARSILSFYGETVVPLVAAKNEIPLVNTFEVTGSGRYEMYSDFGSTLRPKAGANWRPFSTVMLRGSYNMGFSAPSLQDLWSPPSSTIGSAATQIDYYRNTATNEGPYVTIGATAGNPNLKPSKSIGKTVGIALDVPYVKGLTLTADYYQILQHDRTGSRSTTTIYQTDANLLTAYVAQQLAAGVSIMAIDTGGGTPNYKGDPGIIRYSPNVNDIATFAAYNAAHPNAPVAVVGQVHEVYSPIQNLATAYVSGWDYGVHYNIPWARFGRFMVTADASQLMRQISVNAPPGATPVITVSRDKNGGSAVVWRGNLALNWHMDNWSAGASAYYIGNWSDTGATVTQAQYLNAGSPSYIRREFDGGSYVYRLVVDAVMTYNASVGYNFHPEMNHFWIPSSVKFNVSNLTAKRPPLSTGFFGYSEAQFGNLIAGRILSFEVNKDF